MIYTLSTYDTTPAAFADGVQPPASPQWNAAEVQIAYTSVAKGKTKTTGGVILLLLLGAALAFGQTDNTLYVKQFAGATVGAKLTNAMQLCNGNTAIPCILVLDPSLAVYPSGTMPTLCAQCVLSDYRNGLPASTLTAVSRLDGMLFVDPSVGGGYATVSAALSALAGGSGVVVVRCGTYSDNIVFSSSYQRVIGQGRDCVFIRPANTSLPVVTFSTTSNSGGGIANNQLTDVTLQCVATCAGDAVKFTGTDPNDWVLIQRFRITGGFANGQNIAGRTIWDRFEDGEISLTNGNGIQISDTGAVNHDSWTNVQVDHNQGYGLYMSAVTDAGMNLIFSQFDSEYNGLNAALTNCADVYLKNVGSLTIDKSYVEGGCPSNSSQSTVAEIRITGGHADAVDVRNTTINPALSTTWNILNDVNGTTAGTYSGNFASQGAGIKVTDSANVQIELGANHGFPPPSISAQYCQFGGGINSGMFFIGDTCQTTIAAPATAPASQVSPSADGNTYPAYTVTNAARSTYTGRINQDGTAVFKTTGAGAASSTVYRCTTAGTLPVGALTVNTANCGASTDTDFRAN